MTAASAPVRAASDRPSPASRTLRVALVGNPNTGKSTLFNALTGMRQRVADFPGVTVEHAEGSYVHGSTPVNVIDRPGAYSLAPQSPDEAIALDVLHARARGVREPDVIVVVVDAVNLERNLFFAAQVLDLGRPTVIALNRIDRAIADGTRIDVPELIHELGAVVVPVSATRGDGIERLRHAIALAPSLPAPPARRWLREETGVQRGYAWIGEIVERCVVRRDGAARTLSDRVDGVLLHPAWGPLIFLGILLVAFQAMFTVARPIADGIDALVGAAGAQVVRTLPPGDLRSLLVDGVLGGVGSVLVFLPQIAMLFLVIGLLEDSGYIARAVFAVDRYVRPLGLQGRSFIPLVYAGADHGAPALLAAERTSPPRVGLATRSDLSPPRGDGHLRDLRDSLGARPLPAPRTGSGRCWCTAWDSRSASGAADDSGIAALDRHRGRRRRGALSLLPGLAGVARGTRRCPGARVRAGVRLRLTTARSCGSGRSAS